MQEQVPAEAGGRPTLLEFEPVPRKCARRDGWTTERQRDFVALLAITGCQNRAAQAVGLTARGAYQLRRDAGAEGFVRAWDGALAFHAAWSGQPPPAARGFPALAAWPAGAAEPEPEPVSDEDWGAFVDGVLGKYLQKLDMERTARLEGRIVEADFYVRQLTWLEVVFDCGDRAYELLDLLERGGHKARDIVATPMSLLLGALRQAIWEEEGGPERPPAAALGLIIDEIALGEPPECQFSPERDGSYREWPERSAARQAIAAKAQRAWEEKARAEAAEWAKKAAPQ